jgi:type IV pilus assembly protein PilB
MLPFRRLVKKQLGELLIERGIITRTQLDKALQVQREKGGLVGQILVILGFTKEDEIAQALTVQYGFPYLPLQNYELTPEVVKAIPENVCRQYCLIAVDKIGDTLTVSMSNPLNIKAIEDIEMLTNCNVQVFVSTMTDINNAIDKFYNKTKGK